MIAYFDASAFVKLLVREPGTTEALEIWRTSQGRVSSRLLYPEARAGLARARRMRRLGADGARAARERADAFLDEADFVELTEPLALRAGDLAEEHGLRGYDAVHLASFEEIADDDSVLVAADGALLEAVRRHGLATMVLPG